MGTQRRLSRVLRRASSCLVRCAGCPPSVAVRMAVRRLFLAAPAAENESEVGRIDVAGTVKVRLAVGRARAPRAEHDAEVGAADGIWLPSASTSLGFVGVPQGKVSQSEVEGHVTMSAHIPPMLGGWPDACTGLATYAHGCGQVRARVWPPPPVRDPCAHAPLNRWPPPRTGLATSAHPARCAHGSGHLRPWPPPPGPPPPAPTNRASPIGGAGRSGRLCGRDRPSLSPAGTVCR